MTIIIFNDGGRKTKCLKMERKLSSTSESENRENRYLKERNYRQLKVSVRRCVYLFLKKD